MINFSINPKIPVLPDSTLNWGNGDFFDAFWKAISDCLCVLIWQWIPNNSVTVQSRPIFYGCVYLSLSIHTHIYIHICDVCVLISSAHTSLASNQWKHSGYSCFSNRLTTESLWQPVCPGLCLPLNMGFHFIASTLGKQKQQGNNNKKNLMLQPKLELLHKNRREAELLVWCFSSVYSNLN